MDGLAPGDACGSGTPMHVPHMTSIGSIPDYASSPNFGSIIHFTTTSVWPLTMTPWKVANPQTSTGTGFHIGERRILTNSHVVRHNQRIELRRHGQPGVFIGRLLCESTACDLALLTVDDDHFWEKLPSETLHDAVPLLGDTVDAVGYPMGAQSVTVTRGVVSLIFLSDLSLGMSPGLQLTVQIDAAMNPGNSGGPVFDTTTRQVVGVSFSGQPTAQGVGYIIPTTVVNLFLTQYAETQRPDFGRLPSLGIAVETLVNPALRKHCFGGETPPHRYGCLVTYVDPNSAAKGKLEIGDVLLKIDGITISEEGDVKYRGHERLPWPYLISRHRVGHEVSVTVLRPLRNASAGEAEDDGAAKEKDELPLVPLGAPEELTFEISLRFCPRVLPEILGVDYHLTYVIIGGLLFLPAGLPLLLEARNNKAVKLAAGLDKENSSPLEDPAGQSCVLAGVLPHAINTSYDKMIGEVVCKVNGEKVKDMRHLAAIFSAAEGSILVDFKAKHGRCFLILDAAEALSCRDDILAANAVPHWCSPSLLEDTEAADADTEAAEAAGGS